MGAEDIRDALRGLNAALEGQTAEGSQTLSVQTLAAVAVKCLGEEGLRELVGLLADALAEKQERLEAGSNISIIGNVISAADTDTGATSVSVSGISPLTLTGSYSASDRKITIGGSVDLSGYVTTSSLSGELDKYLPLSGGTLTGDIKVGNTTVQASDGHIVLPSGVEIY